MPTQNFRVGEMLNKRTRNSKTWINFDGSYTTEIYAGDIHYEDEYGNWHNINTDLFDEADFDSLDLPVAREGKERFYEKREKAKHDKKKNMLNRDLYDYQGLQVPFDCKIPRNFKRGYTIGKGQASLTFKPVNASPAKGYVEDDKKNCIHYQDAWNDTDVCLEVTPNGIKETIILKTDRAPFSFSFEVDGPLEDDLTAGNLKLQPAWLQDANGEKRDVNQTIRREGDKTYIDLVADVTGLVYPIEIDPTVTIQPDGTAGKDTRISYSSPNMNYGNASYLWVGVNDTERSLLKFDLSSIQTGSYVSTATLDLYHYGRINSQNTVDMQCFLVTGSWDEATVTWNTQPSYNSSIYSSILSFQSNDYSKTRTFDITNIANEWVKTGINNGLIIKQVNSVDAGASFYSSESGDATNRPKLSIIYNHPPTTPTVTSPNGGETWNAQHTITWSPATDAETAQGSLKYHIQLSTNNGTTWKDIVSLTSVGATSYTYDFTNEPETSTAKIRIRAYDGTSYGPWDESNGVFTIQHNQAPTIPTNLSPSGGVAKDRSSVIRLAWQHNDSNGDPQAQFDLQWRLQGAPTWNTVSQATPNQYWDAPGGTFPRGTIEWRVRTYDQEGLSSPYSDIQTFYAGDKPANPTITSPVEGATVAVANPTIQWSSVGQTAYHMKVLDVADTLLWEINTASTNKAQTVLYDLQNNTSYKIQLAIKNTDGLWSDFETVNINVSYTPPAVPIVTTAKGEATITISIDNPTPQGSEPNVSYNSVFRRRQGESTWTRIATNIEADGSFTDYTPASDQVYEYYVRSWGDNGTYSDSSIVTESVTLQGVWLHDTTDPSTLHQFKYDGDGRSENWQPTAAMMQFAGRKLPIAEYDDSETRSITVNLKMRKYDTDKEMLEKLIRSKNTLCYRDGRGRKMFCHALQLPINDEVYGNTVSITFEEVSYTEEV
jgi:hypothetical protein